MSIQRSDLELISDFRAGDVSGFEELLNRYSPKVYSLALRLTKDSEDAEEVLQDVFVTVHRKIAGFEGKSSFSSWLYRVTVNASLMKLRKRRQESSTVHMEDVLHQVNECLSINLSDFPDAEQAAFRTQLLEVLDQAVRKLPDDYRAVFVLRDIDELSSRETGRILNLTIPAVKSRLHRSRLILRKRLQQFYSEYKNGSTRLPQTANA